TGLALLTALTLLPRLTTLLRLAALAALRLLALVLLPGLLNHRVVVLGGQMVRLTNVRRQHVRQSVAADLHQVVVDGEVSRDVPVAERGCLRRDPCFTCALRVLVPDMPTLVQQRLGTPRVTLLRDCLEVDVQPELVIHCERAPSGGADSTEGE